MTRVVLELENNVDYAISTLPNPWRIVIDLRHHKSAPVLSASAKSRVGTPEAPHSPNGEKLALSSASPSRNNAEKSASAGLVGVANGSKPANGMQASAGGATVPPASVPLETAAASVTQAGGYPAAPPSQVAQASTEAPKGKRIPATREAQPTASGERSLTRVLGLKIGRIVIDAGHGGHDTGTIGPNGLREKDLVLDIALRLGKLLQGRLGADVVYTRDDDTFVPLETRTAIANQEKADLFISIHANSSSDADARGVETYYLNFTSSRDALQLAARENAGSEKTI